MVMGRWENVLAEEFFEFTNKLEGDDLMITSGNNASKNECPTVGTDESQ